MRGIIKELLSAMTQLSAKTAPPHIKRRIERRNPTEGKSKAGGIRKEVIWRDREQMEVDTYRDYS